MTRQVELKGVSIASGVQLYIKTRVPCKKLSLRCLQSFFPFYAHIKMQAWLSTCLWLLTGKPTQPIRANASEARYSALLLSSTRCCGCFLTIKLSPVVFACSITCAMALDSRSSSDSSDSLSEVSSSVVFSQSSTLGSGVLLTGSAGLTKQ